jgi:NADH-quinone oxidoreductase subunit D
MESLIHHFKLWTEGFAAPAESVFVTAESPRGEIGVFLEGDGGPKPFRIHYRTPSFVNLQIMPLITRKSFIADLVGIIGSIDVVLGDADR